MGDMPQNQTKQLHIQATILNTNYLVRWFHDLLLNPNIFLTDQLGPQMGPFKLLLLWQRRVT